MPYVLANNRVRIRSKRMSAYLSAFDAVDGCVCRKLDSA